MNAQADLDDHGQCQMWWSRPMSDLMIKANVRCDPPCHAWHGGSHLALCMIFSYPQLVSSIEPSTCRDAIPKSATRILFFSSSSKFSGFKSLWLQNTRHTLLNLYHSVGKFSRRQIDDIFLIFPRKHGLSFHANWFIRDNFHEMSQT